MSEYLTEQEQIQLIKSWVKQYGLTILAGIILALFISFGYRAYQNHHTKTLLRASALYDQMLTERAQNHLSDAAEDAKKLLAHYAKTPYAQMAAFMLARDAVLQKNYTGAVDHLSWVLDHAKDPAIKEIARIRMARIHLAAEEPQAALDILKPLDDKTFLGMVDEVRGDAYLIMKDAASAKKSYALALQELPNAEVNRPILEMKYENLAGVPIT